MRSFVATDTRGNFTLDGRPWFLHGATYFGRRPGTCGANWMDEHFEHNLAALPRDIDTMHRLGINTVGLFVPSREFYRGIEPREEMFGRLDSLLDRFAAGGIRVVLFALGGISRDAWCKAHGVQPGDGLWHPAVNREAEKARIASGLTVVKRYADRPEVIGYPTGAGRFFRYGFDVPPVRPVWREWLRRRFDGSLDRARQALALGMAEKRWEDIRMPTEMQPYFNHENPRSYEFALMHQVLTRNSTARIVRALKAGAPRQLIIEAMEGCCFSTGHLTTMVPELVAADALWLESYHWEGLRSYPIQSEEERRWMAEPVADRPSAEIICHAGYVHMLARWMRRSGKPLILCHGVDIGEKRRGVRDEADQEAMLDRFNTFFQQAGGHGINYWCWADDELSKTFTKAAGVEYTIETPPEKRPYWQAGETMGLVRYDGTERPVCARVRERSVASEGKAAVERAYDTLVLFPCPVFQSLYRYRANLTGFAVLTSMVRQGLWADVAMSSAGERIIPIADLKGCRLVVLGAPRYTRDHPEVPGVLARFVERGGTLLLPLGRAALIEDPYGQPCSSDALGRLAGCAPGAEVEPCAALSGIRSESAAFSPKISSWSLAMDRPASFTRVTPRPDAEVLVRAGDHPLLYRHRLGKGTVYVFTWDLDVFLYKGERIDYAGDDWDWLWTGLAAEIGLQLDPGNPATTIVRRMCGIAGEGMARG